MAPTPIASTPHPSRKPRSPWLPGFPSWTYLAPILGLLCLVRTGPQALACQEPPTEQQAKESLGRELDVLEIKGIRVSAAEFGNWLVRNRGETFIQAYADALLFERKAAELGIEVSSEQVEDLVQRGIESRIEGAFAGDRAAWEAEFTGEGRSLDGLLMQRRAEGRAEWIGLEVTERLRTIDEPRLRREWEHTFGPKGRSMRVLGVFLPVVAKRASQTQTLDELRGQTEAVANQVQQRAEALQQEVVAGLPFEAAVQQHSGDEKSREQGGLLADVWKSHGWPENFTTALFALKPGEISAPLRGKGGFWILKLVSASEHAFEAERELLLSQIQQRSPDQSDVLQVSALLREGTSLELLPALRQPDMNSLAGRAAPVFTINDNPVSLQRYEQWIRHLVGEVMAPRYAEQMLIERKARELKIVIEEAKVQQRVEEDLNRLLALGYAGSKSEWLRELASRGRDEAQWRREALERSRSDLLCEGLMMRDRVVSEEDVKTEWRNRYGESGTRIAARLIRLSAEVPESALDETEREIVQRRTKLLEPLEAELQKIAQRVREGEDFGALAKRYSDDPSALFSGVPDGGFSLDDYSVSTQTYFAEVKPGDLIGPLMEGNAVYLFEITELIAMPYESVKDSLAEELRTRRPAAIELAAFKNVIMQEAEIKLLPGLYR